MTHVLAVMLSVYVIYLAQPGTSLFSWHPTLMVLGFGIFMFEAIMIFSKQSSLVPTLDRKTKGWYHFYLQIAAAVCIELGFAAIYFNKNRFSKPHFISWHGVTGVGAVAMTTFQMFAGLSLLFPKLDRYLNPMNTSLAIRKQVHATFGCLVFLIGFGAMFLSLYSNFVLKNASGLYWYFMLALILILASVVVNQVTSVYVYKKK